MSSPSGRQWPGRPTDCRGSRPPCRPGGPRPSWTGDSPDASGGPRIVPHARKLHVVSTMEMLEMAGSGARVLQLRSVEFARNHGVAIHVRPTFSDAEGTWIREDSSMEDAIISGITHTTDEAYV